MLGPNRKIGVPQFSEDILTLLRRVHVNMPWKFLPQYLEMILQSQMNVEIGFEAEELDRISVPELQEVSIQLEEAGCRLTLHGPFWDLNPGSLDPLIRHASSVRLHHFFDFVEALHPDQVVCHTGYDPRHHRGHRSFWLETSLTLWEALVKRAEALQVPLLLENVWEDGPELHAQLFERLASPCFGFCLDVGHQHSFSRAPLLSWIDALADALHEVHLHDNDGTQDAHLPIGQGSIDFPMLFDRLRMGGKDPVLTLEPHCEEHLMQSLEGLSRVLHS